MGSDRLIINYASRLFYSNNNFYFLLNQRKNAYYTIAEIQQRRRRKISIILLLILLFLFRFLTGKKVEFGELLIFGSFFFVLLGNSSINFNFQKNKTVFAISTLCFKKLVKSMNEFLIFSHLEF